MSVRAYRINEIKKENNPTFNLWHDTELLKYLHKKGAITEDMGESGGIIEIEVDILEEALLNLKLEDYTIKAIKKDIKFAKNNEDTYLQYYCY
jgi:hypothetical protein